MLKFEKLPIIQLRIFWNGHRFFLMIVHHHFNSISNQPTKAILTVTIKLSSECGFCTRAADSEWWVQFWNRKTVPFWRGVLKRQRNREGRHFFSVNLFLLCGHFSQLSIHGDSTSVWRGVTRRTLVIRSVWIHASDNPDRGWSFIPVYSIFVKIKIYW